MRLLPIPPLYISLCIIARDSDLLMNCALRVAQENNLASRLPSSDGSESVGACHRSVVTAQWLLRSGVSCAAR